MYSKLVHKIITVYTLLYTTVHTVQLLYCCIIKNKTGTFDFLLATF